MAKLDLDDLVQLAGLLNNKEKEEKTELESLLDALGGSNKKDDLWDPWYTPVIHPHSP